MDKRENKVLEDVQNYKEEARIKKRNNQNMATVIIMCLGFVSYNIGMIALFVNDGVLWGFLMLILEMFFMMVIADI
ncbi:MAG: hypothetical protein ACRC5M_06435 [Anaeroplasmataceae bacterium]